MLKKFSVLLFSLVLLTGLICPCLAQEQTADIVSVQAAQDVEAAPADAEGITADNTVEAPDVEAPVDAEKEAVQEETSSGIPAVKKNEVTSSGIPAVVKTENKDTSEERNLIESFIYNFEKTFIRDSRWKLFLEGFGNTVLIALCSTLLGVLIGMVIAVVKVLHAQMDRPNILVNIFNFIFNIYTTVIRGTPAVVQLFIAYYIIFKNTDNYVLVSIFAFGINSGAYVSEIVRGGILSIDRGQLEAGRSLGLSYITTMMFVVIPQAVKNILPSLGNEFILLLKDTSIAGYIGTLELTKAGNIVRSRTFEPYFSLLSVAAIYLVCVILLEQLIKYFERRMSKSDRH